MEKPCPKCGTLVGVDTKLLKPGVLIECPICHERFDQTPAQPAQDEIQLLSPQEAANNLRKAFAHQHVHTNIVAQHPGIAHERKRDAKTDETELQTAMGRIQRKDKGRRLPKILGPYEILEEINRGGMGIVYKGFDPVLRRTVAIKVLLAGEGASDEDVQRFQREAQASARLNHPNIVQIYSIGEYEDKPYVVLDFVEGKTVKQLLEESRISPRMALAVCEDAAEALAHAARQGVIHRDVKPANIIVNRQGQAMLMDFGLAKRVDEDLEITISGTTMGTPSYMSPEQAEGKLHEVDAVSDIYSLGAVLYEMLTGQPPFDGPTTMSVLRKVLDEDPIPPRKLNPRIHQDIETICLKCLEKDKQRRYRNGQELADDIRRFNHGEPIAAAPMGPMTAFLRNARKRIHLTASIFAVFVTGLLALGYNVINTQQFEAKRQAERVSKISGATLQGNRALRDALELVQRMEQSRSEVFIERWEAANHALKDAEARFREVLYLQQNHPEALAGLEDIARYQKKMEVSRLLDKARRFVIPQLEPDGRVVPPNYPAAVAFAEEALARAPENEEAISIRKKAMGIRNVNITIDVGRADVYARLLANDKGVLVSDLPAGNAKGRLLGRTPIVDYEMQPGLYVVTFVQDGHELQEGTLLVDREEEPRLHLTINAREQNMVGIAVGEVTVPVEGTKSIPAFLIDRYEFPNRAGMRPATGVGSLLEAQALCQSAGKQLCTKEQWIRACMGDEGRKWPYGEHYVAKACAAGLDPDETREPFPSGLFTACRTKEGIYDMSGNVSEWTNGNEEDEIVFGGDWTDSTRNREIYLTCWARQWPQLRNKDRSGVRCCKALPQK